MAGEPIYIAGPIANTTDYIERFEQGCLEVVQLGYMPVSPLIVEPTIAKDPSEYAACLRADIRALLECHGIYLLRGWENSRGARLEKLIADGLDLLILYQPEIDRKPLTVGPTEPQRRTPPNWSADPGD